jgi:hypothetical protein
MSNEALVPALTHIAAVHNHRNDSWRVWAVFARGEVPADHPSSHWVFVPGTVQVGDEILQDEGVVAYGDPVWAERYAAGE